MCSRVCGIGPSARRNDQDRAVHLRRARDHVLHVIRVTRAVDVRVVTVLRLVLDVSRRDRDAALALLRRLVDLVEVAVKSARPFDANTLVMAAVNVVFPWST